MDDTTLRMTAQIVSAHISGTTVAADALPELIRSVYKSLSLVEDEPTEPTKASPVVPVKASVFNDHLVCLECGANFKMLKRHLMSDHGLTPDTYRTKFGLPRSYPVVAAGYAKERSKIAKELGLGTFARKRKRRKVK